MACGLRSGMASVPQPSGYPSTSPHDSPDITNPHYRFYTHTHIPIQSIGYLCLPPFPYIDTTATDINPSQRNMWRPSGHVHSYYGSPPERMG